MKIFFPISIFHPSKRGGGPSLTLYWHISELVKNDINTNVVTSTFGVEDDSIRPNHVYHNECGTVYYGSSNQNDLKTIRRALKQIKESAIVHINSLFDPLSICCFFYCRIFYPRKRMVLSVRGQLNPYALDISKYKKTALLFFYKIFYNKVLFHATAEKEIEEIKGVFPKATIFNIPNLINPAKRLNINIEKKILFMGRIHPIKSIHKLIQALALSIEFNQRDFVLEISGRYAPRDQLYFDELEGLILELGLSEKVRFIGHVEGLTKERLYAESYLLVLPSETENFGNVVVESLNQGTPVIASLGTPWSVLEEYGCGFHIENTPEKIGQALDKFLRLDPNQYKLMRKNSSMLVDAKFNIKNGIKDWLKIYGN